MSYHVPNRMISHLRKLLVGKHSSAHTKDGLIQFGRSRPLTERIFSHWAATVACNCVGTGKAGRWHKVLFYLAVSAGSVLLVSACSADALDERANALLPWIAHETGYRADHVKLAVVLVAPKIINMIAYRDQLADQIQVESVSIGETIFLPNWFALGQNDDILVHEVTHVLQFENDAKFRCRADQERQAYETQAAFTDATGIGVKPHPFFMFLLRCPAHSAPR